MDPDTARGAGIRAGASKPSQSGLGEGEDSRPRATGAARVDEVRASEANKRGEAGIFILFVVVGVGVVVVGRASLADGQRESHSDVEADDKDDRKGSTSEL